MASFEIKSAIEAIENADLKKILTEIVTNLTIKDEKIKSLENKVADLEARVDECEIYSSKDCIIMEKLPIKNFNNGNVPPLSHQVCDFLKSYINYETHPSSFKACHPLGPWKNEKHAPAIIVKFVYFGEKNEIYGRKSWLSRSSNPLNGQAMYFKERLPPKQREIKNKAEEEGLITTTYNCQVKAFTRSFDGRHKSVKLNSVKAVHDIKDIAVKKVKPSQKQHEKIAMTPEPSKLVENQMKSLLKRIRSSPDEEGLQSLKNFCRDNDINGRGTVN